MIKVVAGPAGAGKSQYVARERNPGDILIDYTSIWAALTGAERGADGKYPERETGDPALPLVSATKEFVLRQAVERELNGFVTTSARDEVQRLESVTNSTAEIIDPGQDVVRLRLADPETGRLSDECQGALNRWYRAP